MLKLRMDYLNYTETQPFKMNPQHSQPHTQGKTKMQGLHGHHGPTMVTFRAASLSLFLSHNCGFLGGPCGESNEGKMSGQYGQKTCINHQRTIPKHKSRIGI